MVCAFYPERADRQLEGSRDGGGRGPRGKWMHLNLVHASGEDGQQRNKNPGTHSHGKCVYVGSLDAQNARLLQSVRLGSRPIGGW